jgi:outer membrane protein insertion porin family
MTRTLKISLVATLLLCGGVLQAQTTPAASDQPKPPKPGTIIDTSTSGRIVDAPTEPTVKQTGNRLLVGQKIERFEASGNVSVASDTIRVYLGIVPGEIYDPANLQRNFSGLWQTGLFDDIKLEAEQGEVGVIVRAAVKERPRIGSVEYRGNKELTATKIGEALEKAHIDLHIGNTIEQTLVRRAAEAIKAAYTEGGYEGVSVDSITEGMPEPGEQKVVFIINEGIKAKIAGIKFTGNKKFSNSKLLRQMKEVKKTNIITWIRKKDLYIPSKLDEDLEHVKNFYQDYGYQNVTFGDPQVVTTGTKKKPRVKLIIPVSEGSVHTFGDVTVSGNTVFTADQLIGAWPIKKGETIRRKPIQARADLFGDAYRSRGYIYAYVNPEYVEKPNNVVDVHVAVYEGDQFHLGRIEFQGNNTTKDKVLRREIFLQEGMIMDMETFKQSVYKLGQLGYFKVTENPDFKVNPDSKSVDITIKGNEEGKNDVQFGGGYSEGGGFFLQAQFATRNLLGEGESLGLSFQQGNRQKFYSLSYSDPWFMDTPNSLGFSIYDRDLVYPASIGIEGRTRGGSVAYGYRLHRFDSISFIYGLQRSREHLETNIAPDLNGNVPLSDVTDSSFTASSIGPSYGFDSRDNPYDTTRGFRLTSSLAYTGGILGGSLHMFKPTFGMTRFFKLSRLTSFSANVDIGYIKSLNKDCSQTYNEFVLSRREYCVPLTERFLVGGEYSVRGFRYGTLGPRDNYNGVLRPSGGYKQHTVNLEYVIKLNEPLRFVLWGDAGQAYGYNENWNLSKTRVSMGTEFRIFLPVFQFPLRLIYAVNPRKQKGDDFQTVQFTIGNTF